MNINSVNKKLEASFKENWWKLALSNYQGETMNYAMMAERIEMMHVIFQRCGLKPGDRVAICGRNQANWGVCFLAAMTYGAVPVPILHEFNPDSIIYLLGHSESRVFFVDETVWAQLDSKNLPDLEVVVNISDLQCLMSVKDDIDAIRMDVVMEFRRKYPCGLRPEQICYYGHCLQYVFRRPCRRAADGQQFEDSVYAPARTYVRTYVRVPVRNQHRRARLFLDQDT